MSGWIKLYRSLLDWEWYSDCNVVYTFVHLLLEANWEDKKWRGLTIPRGSLVTSVAKLAESLKLTIQQTRTVLNKLKSTNNITIVSTNGYSLITIVDYDLYQNYDEGITNKKTDEETNEQQTNNKPSNKRITTTKESKNQEYNNIYNNFPYPSLEEKTEPLKKYVFEGHVVKLVEKDFTKWKQAYPLVDLTGILSKFDAWVKDQGEDVRKNWFIRCSNYLAKKNKQLEERAKQPNPAVKPSPKADKSEDEKSIWDYYDQYNIPYDPEMRRAHECR